MSVLADILREKSRRAALKLEEETEVAKIKEILLKHFLFTRSQRHCVTIKAVAKVVAPRLNRTVRTTFYKLLHYACAEFGCWKVNHAGISMLRGMHPITQTDEEAVQAALNIRTDLAYERNRHPRSKDSFKRRARRALKSASDEA